MGLKTNAEKLVRVRPVDEAEGDAVSGGVARAASMAARDDLGGALAELANYRSASQTNRASREIAAEKF
jgi:hypothetical protein